MAPLLASQDSYEDSLLFSDLYTKIIFDLERKLKLIWDFRGPVAAKTAEHHEIHLKEFIVQNKLPIQITGVEHIHELHSLAYMVITDSGMPMVRDILKPHRATLYP